MGQRVAFFSPQGTIVQQDNLYEKMQGSTAENGGQVIYVTEMARAISRQGGEVDLFARNYDSDEIIIEEPSEYPGMRVIHIPTSADPTVEKEDFHRYYSEYMAGVFEVIDRDGAVYDSSIGHYADGMFMAAALAERQRDNTNHRISCVGVTHSLGLEKRDSLFRKQVSEGQLSPEKAHNAFVEAVEKYNIGVRLACEIGAFQKMDGIAAVSKGHMDTLFADHGYPEHRMDIIPGGINESIFSPKKLTRPQKLAARESLIDEVNAARQENDIPEIPETSAEAIKSGRVIFGFGRMVEAKGIVNAVKSMKHTLEEHPDAVYVYAGGNIPPKQEEEKRVLEQSLEYAREHGYEDRIVFLGRQDQIKCSEWLDASDVYLHAANLEPFGLAPQEAAATGIPVVLSMNAGVAEVLQNNKQALHVDPLSPQDIAKQTSMILSNPKTLGRRLSDQALRYIEKEATWSGRTSQLLKFSEDAHEYTNVAVPLKTITDADPIKASRLLAERDPSQSQTAEQRALMREARSIMVDLVSSVRTGPAVVLEIDNDKLEAEG